MPTWFLWFALSGPLSLAAVGIAPAALGRRGVRAICRAAAAAALFALTVASCTAIAVALKGPLRTPDFGARGVGFGLYLDSLSATMFCLVSFIGLIVVRYSRNYLDGDPGHIRFTRLLCLTLAAVLLVIVSGNLFAFALAWIATSVGLHHLLLFYADRPAAIFAARKKWIASRLGEVSLIGALVLLYHQFGSLDYHAVFSGTDALHAANTIPLELNLAAILLVVTALLKSAQFPLHGWLVEVMETPTPVSALLHAGIINAGGFLVLRFSHVIAPSLPALETLVFVGGFTALFGSVVMLTQTSIKSSLAFSTIAQMGFMMLECGLAAFPAALLHIVAHSLYKAHAFLSSGSVIDIARASWTPSPGGKPHPARLVFAIVSVFAIAVLAGRLFGFTLMEQPGVFALGAALLLALIHLVAKAIDEQPSPFVIGRTFGAAALVGVAFFALQFGVDRLCAGVFPATEALRNPLGIGVVVLVVGSFATVTFLQGRVPSDARTPRWAALYAHISNGLYVNTLANRFVLRYWPTQCRIPSRAMTEDRTILTVESGEAPADEQASIATAIARACNRIAPLWPLKHFVAVNPFLGFSDKTFHATCAMLHRVARVDMLMPRSFYRDALATGEVEERDLAYALAAAPSEWRAPDTVEELGVRLVREISDKPRHAAHVASVAEVLDSLAAGDRNASRTAFMTDEIAKWCAAYFDDGQSVWRLPARGLRPYAAWREAMRHDRNPEAMGIAHFRGLVAELPEDPTTAIAAVVDRIGVPARAVEEYLYQALLDIGGWAAYARYRVWDNNLYGRRDDTLEQLLAIRIVWGYALFAQRTDTAFKDAWRHAMTEAAEVPQDETLGDDADLCVDLIAHEAYERAYQRRLLNLLSREAVNPSLPPASERRALQAAFCIDVRSEVYRRALEAVAPDVATIGFAGFFGYPIEYIPIGNLRGGAQCPVLLTPAFTVCESVLGVSPEDDEEILQQRRLRRRVAKAWKSFKLSAVSSFMYVETAGLLFAGKLIGDSLGVTRTVRDPNTDGLDPFAIRRLGPRIEARMVDGRQTGFTDDQRVTMAEAVLRAMSLTAGFGRLVTLIGHGSTTVNNPHASGLDCGACGGHTGEANARVAALICNDPIVRVELRSRGIAIPDDTWFLGALHDTTTDDITLYDIDQAPPSHEAQIADFRKTLRAASSRARNERAPRLGIPRDAHTDGRVIGRSRDWAQVRPEWGLARNAAFIAAPRSRTRGIDLDGRAFLHDYDWRADSDFSILTLIMTAPMVVASWINLQYYGSTVNNRVFGAGNKVLHNVTGTIGVLEGNGGDLKAGLPWQSVHDGTHFVHEPLRLNVFLEAPLDAVNDVIAKSDMVRNLVDNRWLHLFAIADDGSVSHKYRHGFTWESL